MEYVGLDGLSDPAGSRKTGSGAGSVGIMDELEHRPDRDAGPQRDEKPSGPAAPAPGRRRLLTGGLSATGVVLTLASRSVLGQMTCQTPSAHGSVNASQEARQLKPVSPNSIAGWISADSWPGNLDKNTVRFSAVFPDGVGIRMIRLLRDTTTQYVSEKYFIASLLNILDTSRGLDACLSRDELVVMWSAVQAGGRYRPATLNWDKGTVVLYLQNNLVG